MKFSRACLLVFLACALGFADEPSMKPAVTTHYVGLGSVKYVSSVSVDLPAPEPLSFTLKGRWTVDYDSLQAMTNVFTLTFKQENASVFFRVANKEILLRNENFTPDSSLDDAAYAAYYLKWAAAKSMQSDSMLRMSSTPQYETDSRFGWLPMKNLDHAHCESVGITDKGFLYMMTTDVSDAKTDACKLSKTIWVGRKPF